MPDQFTSPAPAWVLGSYPWAGGLPEGVDPMAFSPPYSGDDPAAAIGLLSGALALPSAFRGRDLITGEPIRPDQALRDIMLWGLNPVGPAGAGAVRAVGNAVPPGVVEMGAGPVARAVDDIPYHLRPGVEEATPNNPRGLPMDQESRMLRAGEMGFDTGTTLYHGTSEAFDGFSPSQRRGGVYLTDNPEIADIYAFGRQQRWPGNVPSAGPNVVPVVVRGDGLEVSDLSPVDGSHGWLNDNTAAALGLEKLPSRLRRDIDRLLLEQGHTHQIYRDFLDLGGEQSQWRVFDNTALRSPWATFDPLRAHEADLLAAGANPFPGVLTPDQGAALSNAWAPPLPQIPQMTDEERLIYHLLGYRPAA